MPHTTLAVDRILTLVVGEQRVAVPAALVREVGRTPRTTRVPHAPRGLIGLGNVRGTVVPVLSLATLLDREAADERRLVIVEAGELLGLAVDDVGRIADAGAEDEGLRIDVAALIAAVMPARDSRPSRGTHHVGSEEEEAKGVGEGVALLVFALDAQDFALPLEAIDEVLQYPGAVAQMPHADAAVVGSMTARGALLPLLSLRALLGFPPAAETMRSRIVVARIGGHRVGLVVDAVRTTLRVDEDAIDPVPHVLARGSAEARIQAICRIDGGKRLVSILATEHLLRADITARLFQGVESAQPEEKTVEEASEQFLLFRIGSEEFGLPIAAVEEVAQLPAKLTRLPKAPSFVHGVMNLRGAVIPVIDQAERFASVAAPGARRRVVVVRIADLQAGFVVDAVSEILRLPASALQPAPEFGSDQTRVFAHVANLPDEDRIVLIVSPGELLARAEQDLLRALAGSS